MMLDSAPGEPGRPLPRRLLVAASITAGVSFIMWLFLELLFVASIWPAVESPPRQCEAVLESSLGTPHPVHDPQALAHAVREPVNAWSCLAFVFVAGLFLGSARDALARWLAASVATAGLCAMLYHASASRDFRSLDVAGLYAVSVMTVVLIATRLGTLGANTGNGLPAFLVWLGSIVLGIAAMSARNLAIAGVKPLAVPVVAAVAAVAVASMVLVYCLRRADPRKWRLGLGAIAAMAVGFLLEMMDHPGGIWCAPGSLLQPHALWHLLCATSVGLALECLESPRQTAA